MFLIDALVPSAPQDLVFSASDLVSAAECEYQVLRKLDERLGLRERANFETDALMAQAAKLGDAHELRVLNQFYEQFGSWNPQTTSGVYEVDVAADMKRSTLEAKHEESIAALRSGAEVVFQAAFFDGSIARVTSIPMLPSSIWRSGLSPFTRSAYSDPLYFLMTARA